MRPTTLKEAVDRTIEGYGFIDAISEFLDEFYLSGPSERQRMIGEEPGFTGVAFQDAYVGAVGEHLARRWGLDIPAWADDPRRFLDEPHFPEGFELVKPILLRDSPIAFRRRPILAEAEPLRLARFPIKASDHPGVERLRSTLWRYTGSILVGGHFPGSRLPRPNPNQRRTFLSGHNLQLDERISFSATNRRVLSECDDPGVERFRSISADKPLRSWDE